MKAEKCENGSLHSIIEDKGKQPLRENLIVTATAFLQNFRVRDSPLSQKRMFLVKKGLTAEEIDQALERSSAPYQTIVSKSVQNSDPSLWTRWKELCTSMMVVGATCYGSYYLYRHYVEPWIIGRQKEEEDRTTKIERHLQELNKSLSQLRHSLASVESSLSRGGPPADKVTESSLQDSLAIAEIKSDIASIKSLLLSRRQFPSTPSTGIPTWQMKSPPDGTEPPPQATTVQECINGEQTDI